MDKKHIHEFVFGLNKDLDEVRGQTLALCPLPHIDEVRPKESKKKRMLGEAPKDSIITDNAAMVTRTQEGPNRSGAWTSRKLG